MFSSIAIPSLKRYSSTLNIQPAHLNHISLGINLSLCFDLIYLLTCSKIILLLVVWFFSSGETIYQFILLPVSLGLFDHYIPNSLFPSPSLTWNPIQSPFSRPLGELCAGTQFFKNFCTGYLHSQENEIQVSQYVMSLIAYLHVRLYFPFHPESY